MSERGGVGMARQLQLGEGKPQCERVDRLARFMLICCDLLNGFYWAFGRVLWRRLKWTVSWPKIEVRARRKASGKNMRNVIRLVGMFWLIENALQVETVGGRGMWDWGRHGVINVRLSCKFKFVQAESRNRHKQWVR